MPAKQVVLGEIDSVDYSTSNNSADIHIRVSNRDGQIGYLKYRICNPPKYPELELSISCRVKIDGKLVKMRRETVEYNDWLVWGAIGVSGFKLARKKGELISAY